MAKTKKPAGKPEQKMDDINNPDVTDLGSVAPEPSDIQEENEQPDGGSFRHDYKNLKGENFKQYAEHVGDRSFRVVNPDTGEEKPVIGLLKESDSYVFELYRAIPHMVARFPGMKDTPYDFKGITLKSETPINSTKIPVRVALEHNAQILNAHSRAGHGTYYLLKQ